MAVQNGRDLLIKMEMTGAGAFRAVAGVFREDDTDGRARQVFFAGEVPRFQVVIPDFGTVEGRFQITALEYAGSHNGEATYEMTMASAGALSFEAL